MEQVNYRGYARSVGFDPIKAPYQALDRMAEHDNQVIRNMDRQRQQIKEVRNDYQRGLERKFQAESQNRERNYQWEQRLDENRQRAEQRNAQTEIKSAIQRGDNAKQTFESLAKFSTTIADTLTEYKKQKEKEDYEQGLMDIAAGNIDPKSMQSHQNGVALLNVTGAQQDQIAGGFQDRGADPMVVTNLLFGSKSRQHGQLVAYSQLAASEFPDYARQRLLDSGATTAPDMQAAAQSIFIDFLKEKGLYGLKDTFLAESLLKMRSSYNAIVSEARKNDIVAKSEELRSQAFDDLYQNKTGESLVKSFNLLTRTYGPDGKTPLGRAGAKAELFKELSDAGKYSDEDVQRILNEAITDQGTSWAERFPREIESLMEARRDDKSRMFSRDQDEERRGQQQAEEALLQYVKDEWNGDEEVLQGIIRDAKTKGIPTDRLQAYLAYSNQQKNEDFWNKEFEESYNQGLLTLDDVDQPGVPMETRQKWRQLAQEQEKSRADSGVSKEDLKATFKSALQANLIGDSTTTTPHYSLTPAIAAAMSLYNRKFKEFSQTMEPAAAAAKAQDIVLRMIGEGVAQGDKPGKGLFAVIPSSQATGKQAFFREYTSGSHPHYFNVTQPYVAPNQRLDSVKANPALLDSQIFINRGELVQINDAVKNGRPITIPWMVEAISTRTGIPVRDILNRQLKAAGLQAQVQPGFRDNLLNQLNDPRLRAILDQPLTQDRLNTTIIGSGNTPATIRTGAPGFQDVVAVTQAAGFAHPAVAAAMWALESGWGKYHSGRNNVFNIKAPPGQGTMMASPEGDGRVYNSWWRDYASPLESAKDFTRLMTDPRYARPLAAARTPRQAAQAIFSAGYATDPQYVTKVVSILKAQGINPDQVYAPAAAPTRNTAYMRPTLAYYTGDLGSPGQSHLDVKQWDNPNTPANEDRSRFGPNDLDNYVTVQDPEFGNIPIGALRQKLPGRGDNYDQHVARGSHGIDYPTAMGSQIFIRNGARIISRARTQWGDKLVIQLPDGRRFSFLHGTAA
jgi:hypothetical protein